jgi:hypothetical protein
MENLGLDPNINYEGQKIFIKHKNGKWYYLKKTTPKMVVCVDDDNQDKRMFPKSIVKVLNENKTDQQDEDRKESINFEWNETIYSLYGGGESNPQFDNDFGMASCSDFVVDNDGMFD